MKRITSLIILTMYCLTAFAQVSTVQEKSKEDWKKLTFEVDLNKTNYVQLEPIYGKFKLSNQTEGLLYTEIPDFLQDTMLRVNFKGKIKEVGRLASYIGRAEKLPGHNIPAFQPEGIYEKDLSIEINATEIFPESGNYQIQFFLYGAKGIASNIIEITIEEPSSINKEAFDYLSKYENAMSFYWVWKEKDGISLLETFVNKYGESAYGESAISYLGNVYSAKGEIDKAKAEFEKIKSSENAIIAKEANKSLADIAKRKADLQGIQNQKEKP